MQILNQRGTELICNSTFLSCPTFSVLPKEIIFCLYCGAQLSLAWTKFLTVVIPCGRIAKDKCGESSRWSGSCGAHRYINLCPFFHRDGIYHIFIPSVLCILIRRLTWHCRQAVQSRSHKRYIKVQIRLHFKGKQGYRSHLRHKATCSYQ